MRKRSPSPAWKASTSVGAPWPGSIRRDSGRGWPGVQIFADQLEVADKLAEDQGLVPVFQQFVHHLAKGVSLAPLSELSGRISRG
jgi:hypothetical protein